MSEISTTPDSPRKTQILVVEDERIIALNLKERLESLGFAVPAMAASGEKAIEQATQLRPDLVLMDIRLQGNLDGISAAQHIWDTLQIPVIYLTGNSDENTMERAKVTAPFGYILKPVKERELSVAIDIALKRYEREQMLDALLKGMGDGVIVVDKEQRIKSLNKVAEGLTGWQLSEARERQITEVFKLVDEQTQQPVDNPVIAALQQDAIMYLGNGILLCSKDGKTIPVGDSAAPIKDKKGAIAAVVVVFRDITSSSQLEKTNAELKRTLEELKRTQTQLIQSEKMSSIGQMAATVVNELNNPISIIYGNLSIARQYHQNLLSLIALYQQTYSNPTPDIQSLTEAIDLDFLRQDWPKLLDSMQVGAERIQEIVLSLLSLSNFPKLNQLELKPIDIHDNIDNTLRLLRHRLRAEGKRPEIQVIKDYSQLPKVTCYASQLNQVFMHLLNNAIDALENQPSPRTITIRTSLISDEPSITTGNKERTTDRVVIRIADNGCGMSEDVQWKIFDPFFTTKPVGRGAGLGLSISYQIVVDRHGGRLTCELTPGQETEFAIELPIVPG